MCIFKYRNVCEHTKPYMNCLHTKFAGHYRVIVREELHGYLPNAALKGAPPAITSKDFACTCCNWLLQIKPRHSLVYRIPICSFHFFTAKTEWFPPWSCFARASSFRKRSNVPGLNTIISRWEMRVWESTTTTTAAAATTTTTTTISIIIIIIIIIVWERIAWLDSTDFNSLFVEMLVKFGYVNSLMLLDSA